MIVVCVYLFTITFLCSNQGMSVGASRKLQHVQKLSQVLAAWWKLVQFGLPLSSTNHHSASKQPSASVPLRQ